SWAKNPKKQGRSWHSPPRSSTCPGYVGKETLETPRLNWTRVPRRRAAVARSNEENPSFVLGHLEMGFGSARPAQAALFRPLLLPNQRKILSYCEAHAPAECRLAGRPYSS